MEINKDIQNPQIVLRDLIYYTYLASLKKYPDSRKAYEKTIFALENLLENHNYNAFTRTDNIRKTLMTTFPDTEDAIDVILDNFIDTMLQDSPTVENQIPLFNAMLVTNNSRGKTQVLTALKSVLNKKDYSYFSRYHNGNQDRNYRQKLITSLSVQDIVDIIASMMLDSIITEKEYQYISQNIGKQYANQISNFQINPNAFNQCKKDIIEGKQINFKRCNYSLGNDLYASIDMGNKRTNQEDSVIILNHPQNPNFKMLVVADGMGGLACGEKVSSFVTSQITKWFESLSPQYFASQNIEYLRQCFNQEIQNISKDIYHTYRGNASSTFVGAIVADEKTLISNVGDSRAYIYSQGELHQLSEDDSVSYDLWKNGIIHQKDDIRFHKQSNIVTKGMGFTEELTPTTSIISNSDYDTLLLFSDGITDCLSDYQIMAITRSTSPKNLAKALVDAAQNNNSRQNHLNFDEYNNYIPGGKDNSTAAVYDKRSKNSREEGR